MKITRDEPGQLLEISGETQQVPAGVGWVGAAVALGVLAYAVYGFVTPFFRETAPDEMEIVFNGLNTVFWVAIVAFPLRFLARKWWQMAGLRINGRAGELALIDRSILGGRERTEVVPLTQLAGLRFERAAKESARLTFRIDRGGRGPRERQLDLEIEGLDTREEVADLAYRLGAAAGLLFQRVVRSDPRQMEIELSRTPGEGFTRTPRVEGRADYARDQVSAAATAAAARETIPPFDPKQFQSDHAVKVWDPRREVRFQKALGFAAIGCLPVLLGGLAAGPWVYAMASRPGGTSSGSPLVGALVVGLFGLVFAFVAGIVIAGSLPHRTVLDWTTRTISAGGWFKKQELAFADVTALLLKCVHTHHPGSKNSAAWEGYKCELRAELRGGTGSGEPFLLVATNEHKEDPDTPYRQALPLATELAEALDVPRQVVEYT